MCQRSDYNWFSFRLVPGTGEDQAQSHCHLGDAGGNGPLMRQPWPQLGRSMVRGSKYVLQFNKQHLYYLPNASALAYFA